MSNAGFLPSRLVSPAGALLTDRLDVMDNPQTIFNIQICTAPECERPSRAKIKGGPCDMHKQRLARGYSLTDKVPGARRSAEEILRRNDSGEKRCTKCDAWKPESKFEKSPYSKDGLKSECRYCAGTRVRLWQKGIKESEYNSMLEAQGGMCAICGQHESEFNGTMNIDHDHSCCPGKKSCGKCVRGLLCPACNMGIGALGDSADRLEKAIAYLIKNGARA